MAGVNGTYIHEKNENYEAFLKYLGIPENYIEKLTAAHPRLEVDLSGNVLKVVTHVNTKTFENTVTLGQPSTVTVPGMEYELNATFSGRKATGTVTIADKKGDVTIDITDDGFIQTTNFDGLITKRYYKRQ